MSESAAKFAAEFIGTMILVLLGDGVVANVCLKRHQGKRRRLDRDHDGLGPRPCSPAVVISGEFSGAHLNPAVTIALAAAGQVRRGQGPAVPHRPVPRRRGRRTAGVALLQGPFRRQHRLRRDPRHLLPPARRFATRSGTCCAK